MDKKIRKDIEDKIELKIKRDIEYLEGKNTLKVWLGEGYCKAQHIKEPDDWCNDPTVEGGDFCKRHTCMIRGCKEEATIVFPLLEGEPRLCGKHYRNPPKSVAKLVADSE